MWTLRLKAGSFIAAPHDRVGGAFDLSDLVAVDRALVAGEVDHPAALRAKCLADREKNGVAEPTADQQDGFVGMDLGGMPSGSH